MLVKLKPHLQTEAILPEEHASKTQNVAAQQAKTRGVQQEKAATTTHQRQRRPKTKEALIKKNEQRSQQCLGPGLTHF